MAPLIVNEALAHPEISLPSLAAALAITLHYAILKRVEVDHLTLQLAATSTIAFVCFAYTLGLWLAMLTWTSFYGTLTVTILLYRAFFHPLRNFPGPFGARLSKWWTVKQVLSSNFKYFNRVHPDLQRQYGDYVRTGPREICIYNTAAIQPILGFNTKTTKGPYYDVLERSLQLTRDKVWHRQRRKVWDHGMKKSLAEFGPRVEDFTTNLLTRIEKSKGAFVPLNEFCYHYSYDVMSALAFSRPMGFSTGEATEMGNKVIEILEKGLMGLGLMCHVPWFMNAIATLTSSIGPMKVWEQWTRDSLNTRRSIKDPEPDLMTHLLAGTPRTPEGEVLLFGEARLIIAAGSDTTANNLTATLLQVALHPEYQDAIRKEASENEYSCSRSLPVIESVINESMRLWPAIYFPSHRVTPPEGLQIPGGRFIPGNTIISVPAFALARDARYFPQPDDFIPERWTSRPELCTDKSAFFPFLSGPYVCAGKNLAMMEMRSVISRVLRDYDVILPDNFDPEAYFSGIQDYWVIGLPKVDVRFVKRQN